MAPSAGQTILEAVDRERGYFCMQHQDYPNVMYIGAESFQLLCSAIVGLNPFNSDLDPATMRYAGMRIIRVQEPRWLHLARIEGYE